MGNVYLRTLEEIYRAFDFFNDRFVSGMLKTPIISISSNNGIPMHGWFGVDLWRHGDRLISEINLSAETLNRKPGELFATLLHEMAHLKNHQLGIVDVDLITQYHNHEFRCAAQSMGLRVRMHRCYGYSTTWCGPLAIKAIFELNPDEELICNLHRQAVDMSMAYLPPATV